MPTFQAIHLGDVLAGDVNNASHRDAFISSGQGWGNGQTDPLSDLSLVEIDYTTTSSYGSINTNGALNSSISYDVPGGTTGAQDVTGVAHLLFEITTVDDFGVETTHPNINMVLFQGADGQEFLIPYWGASGNFDYYTTIGADEITGIVATTNVSTFGNLTPPSNTWADTGFPPTPDGTVDGEDTGEVMDLGYDDSTGATHGGGDIITSGDNVIEGNGGDDTITTGAGSDMIDGGTGHDSISGGAGNDTIIGGAGSDTILLGDGYLGDSITGGEDVGDGDIDVIDASGVTNDGIDVFLSGSESGAITSSEGTANFVEIEGFILTDQADSFDGFNSSADLSVDAGAGDDTLTGGNANNTLLGGDGDDLFNIGYGSDNIVGGDGTDTLSIDQADDALNLNFTGDGQGTFNDDDGDSGVFSGIEAVVGSAGNDTINAAADTSGVSLSGMAGDDSLTGGSGDDSIIGGTGDDFVTGGTGADTFDYSVGDGNDTISDFNIGNTGTLSDGDASNNDSVDLSGFYDNLHELYADQADDGVLNQSNTTDAKGRTVDYTDNSSFGSGSLKFTGGTGDNSFFTVENTGVVCFASGTRIRIPGGEVPIETLRRGDLVVTRDNGVKPILWIGSKELSQADLAAAPNLRPVRLAAGYFGLERDLIVSPQHGVLLRDRTGGGSEILYRACHLSEMGGGAARIMNGCRNVTYIHMLFEQHEAVFSNGIASESLYPGPMAYQSLDAPAQNELASLFPDLGKRQTTEAYGASARAYSCRQSLPKHLRDFRETC